MKIKLLLLKDYPDKRGARRHWTLFPGDFHRKASVYLRPASGESRRRGHARRHRRREFLQGYITFVAQQDKAAETEVETAIHVEQARNLQILLGAVENLCSNYGRLFDGH